MIRRHLAALAVLLASATAARAQQASVKLFRVVGPRDEVFIGFIPAALAAMGSGPEVERIARKLAADGQITAWKYAVGRAPDGSTRFATARRIAVMRNDTLRIEPYAPALPVAPPPAE
jgi:hypothetical protein